MNEKKLMVHEKSFDIAWGDMDALGHVNNGRYFDYFQEARIDWLLELDLNLSSAVGPVLLKIGCTFLRPVVFPARLTLRSYLHSIGRSSLCIDQTLLQNDVVMAEGKSKLVWVDYQSNTSVEVPNTIRQLLES